MSGSGRKQRSTKWDSSRDQSPFDEEHPQEDGRSSKSGRAFYHRESGLGWQSPEDPGSNGAKWSNLETGNPRSKHDTMFSSREPFSGGRGSHKNEKFDKEHNRYGDEAIAWGEDREYGIRMSPGLDEWGQQNPSQSPKSGWSRSLRDRSRSRSRSRGRSKSPGHSLRRESGFPDRNRSRSSQVCKDFSAGRCRRGDHCHFLHDSDENYDDYWDNNRHKKGNSSKYSNLDTREYASRSGRSSIPCNDFVRGRCRRGATCRFEHHGASDEFAKSNEREHDRRKRDTSTERGVEHEFRRSNDIPCKFFAAGNCRNGKLCRFSHQTQEYLSPDRKTQDKLASGHKSEDVNQVWDGPKWTDDPKLSVEMDGKNGGPDPSSTGWSMNDRLRKNVNSETIVIAGPGVSKEATNSNEKEALQRKTDGLSGSRLNEKWLEDMDMSPEWNYPVPSSKHIVKEEQTHVPRRSESFNEMSLKACKQGVNEMVPTRFSSTVQPTMKVEPFFGSNTTALPYEDKNAVRKAVNSHSDLNISVNIVSTQGFDQNGQNVGGFPFPSLSPIDRSQTVIPQSNIPSMDTKPMMQPEFQDRIPLPPQVTTGISQSSNLVSGEQLKNLSASLVHLLGNEQLPQIYAALSSNSSTVTPSVANPVAPVFPVSTSIVQPNPVQDTTEPRPQIGDNPPGFALNDASKTSVPNGNSETQQKSLNPSSVPIPSDVPDRQADVKIDEQNQKSKSLASLEPNASSEVRKGKKEKGSASSKKSQEENGKVDDSDIEKEKTTNGKKSKEVKGVRAFKFALVDFVKELLKPSWKEGQIDKDNYKTIVKKVVDKVTATMQGASIPQTQEKIDNYLSVSKEKLTKLVQAYVDKSQKV